jgi:hypothetical protein
MDILTIRNGLLGEQSPLHQVCQMSSDISKPFSLLADIQERGGTLLRNTVRRFQKRM